ncbi:hypothetical protein BP5796_10644 [Coleophoma crateriformis]|uniref:Uncharacterized protein n=1 Tax=Coleophoma crateriformis TaxID=565419 RepID=A0A3D8QQQ6_9HELO|nr:hypothetical protein BP5796_10644 [Coleophoma crateriformis]
MPFHTTEDGVLVHPEKSACHGSTVSAGPLSSWPSVPDHGKRHFHGAYSATHWNTSKWRIKCGEGKSKRAPLLSLATLGLSSQLWGATKLSPLGVFSSDLIATDVVVATSNHFHGARCPTALFRPALHGPTCTATRHQYSDLNMLKAGLDPTGNLPGQAVGAARVKSHDLEWIIN